MGLPFISLTYLHNKKVLLYYSFLKSRKVANWCSVLEDFLAGFSKFFDFTFFLKSPTEIFQNGAQVCYFATFLICIQPTYYFVMELGKSFLKPYNPYGLGRKPVRYFWEIKLEQININNLYKKQYKEII